MNTVDFGWVQSSGCSLHHQGIVDCIAQSVARISTPSSCRRKKKITERRQAEGYKEEDENSVTHVSRL